MSTSPADRDSCRNIAITLITSKLRAQMLSLRQSSAEKFDNRLLGPTNSNRLVISRAYKSTHSALLNRTPDSWCNRLISTVILVLVVQTLPDYARVGRPLLSIDKVFNSQVCRLFGESRPEVVAKIEQTAKNLSLPRS